MVAATHGGNVDIWRPESTAAGSSAAGQAMRNQKPSPAVDYGYTADGSSRALMAATGAMSGRKRAGSSPTVTASYPDAANSAANALNAATIAHKPKAAKSTFGNSDGLGSSTIDVARIHNAAVTNLSREMYTSYPPVAPEVEEKNRQAGIHAAALSMARQIYDIQQKTMEDAAGLQRSDSVYAATNVHRRKPSVLSSTEDSYKSPPLYVNLQQAAQKLAAERLAKLDDKDAAYRDYYGAHAPIQSRLSVRGRLRRRASSDGGVPESDEVRSRQIRSEMSLFNDKLAQVDAKKRQKDRDSLLAAAQRNVAARMSGMDQKVFDETGKASPAMMSEWEAKAKARAEAESSARMVNHGKVNIGGGRYMDQSEVEAIAAARVQPTLDEITKKADAQRERDEKARQEAEEQKQIAEEKAQIEKERNTKTKEEWKRFKGMETSRLLTVGTANRIPDEEKREERAKKDEEKARKAEEKRLRNEEKRKSKIQPEAETSGIEVDPELDQVKTSETPVLEPSPQHDPLSTEAAETTISTTTEPAIESAPMSEGEAIAQRVFSQPVKPADEPLTSPLTSTEEAPSVIAAEESTAPATEPTASVTDTASLPKHTDPIDARITPTTAPATSTMETQITGDSSKADSGKLSAWLKGKFRRVNKSGKGQPEHSEMVISDPTSTTLPSEDSRVPTTTTTITGGDAVKTPTTPGASSALEVAMAGKDHPTSNAAIEPTHSHPTALNSHPPILPAHSTRTHSTSISSLSSDEPTAAHHDATMPVELLERGRSRSLRRAATGVSTDDGYGDREQDYINSLKEQANPHGGLEGTGMDDHMDREEELEGEGDGEEEEFEEARDTFDAEQLPLPSFPKEVAEGRKESPVRETRFHEEL